MGTHSCMPVKITLIYMMWASGSLPRVRTYCPRARSRPWRYCTWADDFPCIITVQLPCAFSHPQEGMILTSTSNGIIQIKMTLSIKSSGPQLGSRELHLYHQCWPLSIKTSEFSHIFCDQACSLSCSTSTRIHVCLGLLKPTTSTQNSISILHLATHYRLVKGG